MLRDRLNRLFAERQAAELEGLSAVEAYMADLEDEIAATHAALVGMAVTEIATLRGELFGAQWG
jgi:hypothetical protein